VAPPQVDLTDLQNAVGQYLNAHNIVIGAGPLTAAGVFRVFVSKSKLATTGVVVGGAWMAVQAISTPMLHLFQEQFGYLQGLLGG
jgi:hypothetical protein